MKNIKNFDDFVNEEISIKKAIAGGLLATGLMTGLPSCGDKPVSIDKISTEIVDNQNFKTFKLEKGFMDKTLYVSISDDNVISVKFKVTDGKTMHSRYTITINEQYNNSIKELYYKKTFWESDLFVSKNEYFKDKINLNDYKIIKETTEYTLLENNKILSFNPKYILFNSNYTDYCNEFTIDNEKYTMLELENYYFVVKY